MRGKYTFKSGDFSEIERFVYTYTKNPGRMILSILYCVPPSVEFLGPTIPFSFQTMQHSRNPQFSNKIDTPAAVVH